MPDAFITATSGILPGPPVSNDEIEDVLGRIGEKPSRLRDRILRNNGIQKRHYAIDRETGRPNRTSAQLAADAARLVCEKGGVALTDVELLACGTGIPEHITPGHASMVHGELGSHACEIASTHAVCCAGVTALKYAAMAVQTGSARTAISTAVERTSGFLRASHFTSELRARTAAEEADPYVGFDQEFLRWMLSDGAGATLVQDRPRPGGLSLKIEWIDLVSFAHELPTCMYMGGVRDDGGGLRSWRDLPNLDDALRGGHFNLHQDTKLLGQHMVPVTVTRTLEVVRRRRGLRPDDVTWVLPHYSSEFFRQKAYDELIRCDFPLPYERWCSNLVERGNTGSASILIMLDDHLASGRVRPGDGLLLVVPESGRFSCAWAFLRAVEA